MTINYHFFPALKKSFINIPNNLTHIEHYTFYNCRSLTSITLPNGLVTIGQKAFLDCSKLSTVTIPETVTSIEDYAFQGCGSIATITCYRSTPPGVGILTFYNVYTPAVTLRVPQGSVQYYKDALIWGGFNIVGFNVGIEDIESGSITIYPNPTTGYFRIKNLELRIEGIEIYDVYGRNVGGKFPSNILEGWQPQADGVVIDLTALQPGVYFVRIQTEAGEVVRKVVKE